MLVAQGGQCANGGCKATVPGGRGTWHVDHDHLTGKVRALLCNACNTALALQGDGYDNDRIVGLYEYAVEHGPPLIGGPGALFVLKDSEVRAAA